jgi:hypothetical protein
MKALIAALVFLNALAFAYFRWVAPPPPAPPMAPAPRALRLVGEPAPKGAVPAASCRSIGPLRDADVSRLAMDWLKSTSREAHERSLEVDAPPTFWVVTVRKTPALALRLVQQLRAAGVTDVDVVPPDTGDGETRVSLGSYPDRPRAERRVLDLKGYALGPTILEQPRRVRQWWLDVEVGGSAPAPDLAALVKAVPDAAGAGLGPCVVTLPPGDPEPAAVKPPAPPPAAPANPKAAAAT